MAYEKDIGYGHNMYCKKKRQSAAKALNELSSQSKCQSVILEKRNGLRCIRSLFLGLKRESKCRIAGTSIQFYQVKLMIRGLGVETTLTYSQTLNR